MLHPWRKSNRHRRNLLGILVAAGWGELWNMAVEVRGSWAGLENEGECCRLREYLTAAAALVFNEQAGTIPCASSPRLRREAVGGEKLT